MESGEGRVRGWRRWEVSAAGEAGQDEAGAGWMEERGSGRIDGRMHERRLLPLRFERSEKVWTANALPHSQQRSPSAAPVVHLRLPVVGSGYVPVRRR